MLGASAQLQTKNACLNPYPNGISWVLHAAYWATRPIDAREREVFEEIRATMLLREDVLDLQTSQRRGILMPSAVFTAVVRSLAHLSAGLFVHRGSQARLRREIPPSLGLEHRDEMICADIAFILGPFVRLEFAVVGLLRERLDARLQVFRSFEVGELPNLFGREQPQERISPAIERRRVNHCAHGWQSIPTKIECESALSSTSSTASTRGRIAGRAGGRVR